MITDDIVERAAIKAWNVARDEDPSLCAWEDAREPWRDIQRNEARAVLEFALTLGPSREAILVQYRCTAPGVMIASKFDPIGTWPDADIARRAEDIAHAMLAAERPADDPARDESGDAAPVLRKALALALRALQAPHDDELRRKTIEAISPAVDPESTLNPGDDQSVKRDTENVYPADRQRDLSSDDIADKFRRIARGIAISCDAYGGTIYGPGARELADAAEALRTLIDNEETS